MLSLVVTQAISVPERHISCCELCRCVVSIHLLTFDLYVFVADIAGVANITEMVCFDVPSYIQISRFFSTNVVNECPKSCPTFYRYIILVGSILDLICSVNWRESVVSKVRLCSQNCDLTEHLFQLQIASLSATLA